MSTLLGRIQVQTRRVIFIGQRQAEGMKAPLSACLISITDPGRPEAKLKDGWLGILRLSFHDVDQVTFPGANPNLEPLSTEQAQSIAKFIMDHQLESRRLVVHCRHGISRSSAVAKAACGFLELPFPSSYREFNREVYERVLRALRSGA
jgi:predicted protein tyrosine phosphatase